MGEDSFSFFDMLLDLMNGETGQLKEEFSDLIREVFSAAADPGEGALCRNSSSCAGGGSFDKNLRTSFRKARWGSEFLCYLSAASDYAGQGLLGEMIWSFWNFLRGWELYESPLSGLLPGCGSGRGHCGKRHVLSAGTVAITAVQVLLAGVICK